MTRFDSQDGTRLSKSGLVHDGGGSAEVCADSHALKHGSKPNKGSSICRWERIDTFGDGRGAQCFSEEVDMGGFIERDLLQVVVEWVSEAGGDEISLGVVLQTLAVEFVLQVLEGKCKI